MTHTVWVIEYRFEIIQDGLFQFNFKLDFHGSNGYYFHSKIRKNGTGIQLDRFNGDKSSTTSNTGMTFYTTVKVNLMKGDTIDMYSTYSVGTYDLLVGSGRSYFEGKLIRRSWMFNV